MDVVEKRKMKAEEAQEVLDLGSLGLGAVTVTARYERKLHVVNEVGRGDQR